MSVEEQLNDLLGEIEKTSQILGKISAFYDEFIQGEYKTLGETRLSAICFAEIFDNYYTGLETLFLRIAQFYGNNLRQEKWHTDLLHKMTLSLPEVRIALLRDETAGILQEFLKFRHFRRYYFEFDYDWDKLNFLNKKFRDVHPLLKKDLSGFADFLRRLRNSKEKG